MFFEIFSVLAPIFITVGIGYGWAKSGRSYDTDLITSIVTLFGTPCLLFYALSTVDLQPQTLLHITAAALLANVCFIVLGAPLLALFKLPQRTFLQVVSFPNIGNIGLPLCFLAFGDEGLALAVTFFAVYAVFQMTVGVTFVSREFSLAGLVRMPVIPAIILAAVFYFSAIPVPQWLFNTTKLIGDMTIPLMLFTLGVSLSRLKIKGLKAPLFVSVLRLSMGFLVGVTLAALLGLSGPAAGVVIMECTMPAAVFCYLFAQRYDQRPEEVAGVVIISTLLSFATLPALLWYVL